MIAVCDCAAFNPSGGEFPWFLRGFPIMTCFLFSSFTMLNQWIETWIIKRTYVRRLTWRDLTLRFQPPRSLLWWYINFLCTKVSWTFKAAHATSCRRLFLRLKSSQSIIELYRIFGNSALLGCRQTLSVVTHWDRCVNRGFAFHHQSTPPALYAHNFHISFSSFHRPQPPIAEVCWRSVNNQKIKCSSCSFSDVCGENSFGDTSTLHFHLN